MIEHIAVIGKTVARIFANPEGVENGGRHHQVPLCFEDDGLFLAFGGQRGDLRQGGNKNFGPALRRGIKSKRRPRGLRGRGRCSQQIQKLEKVLFGRFVQPLDDNFAVAREDAYQRVGPACRDRPDRCPAAAGGDEIDDPVALDGTDLRAAIFEP